MPMPTYDYECDHCGHRWELFQRITEDPITKCPECGKRKARRLLGTGAAIVFKGSGFYQTDYRSESYKKAAAAESKSGTTDKKDGGAKSKSEGGDKSGGSTKTDGGGDKKT